MMRSTIALLVAVTGFSGGCAMMEAPTQRPVLTSAVVQPRNTLETGAARTQPRFEPARTALGKPQSNSPTGGEAPFAVIKVDPRTGKLMGEMELQLQRVVDEARRDERILIRLEGYVPGSGSPGLDLSRAEKTLQIVKERLVGSGITQRRVLISSFGAEHDIQRDPAHHWVEIHLIRTGQTSWHAAPDTGGSPGTSGAR